MDQWEEGTVYGYSKKAVWTNRRRAGGRHSSTVKADSYWIKRVGQGELGGKGSNRTHCNRLNWLELL